ncbi:MAG: hypothetical protein ABWY30_09485, partial [Microterricola sp.]
MPSTQPPPAEQQPAAPAAAPATVRASTPASAPASAPATVRWNEGGVERQARWRSEGGWPVPETVVIADEKLAADEAFRLVGAGTALLWRGDFQAARQLLSALGTRIDKRNRRAPRDLSVAFRQHREQSFHRARLLSLLLIPLAADYSVPLRRAPQVADACTEAYGPAASGSVASGSVTSSSAVSDPVASGVSGTAGAAVPGDSVVALRELLGVIGAHEWRRRGVDVPELDVHVPGEAVRPGRIHP